MDNPWKHIPLSLISMAERVKYDDCKDEDIKKWATDSFFMRGVYFDGQFWLKSKGVE